jgi:hypothetical protein
MLFMSISTIHVIRHHTCDVLCMPCSQVMRVWATQVLSLKKSSSARQTLGASFCSEVYSVEYFIFQQTTWSDSYTL